MKSSHASLIKFKLSSTDDLALNAKYKSIIRDTVIDLIVEFDELDKIFVDRINVYGNYITDEKVVRNTLIGDEGDAYNEILFDKSIQNLKKRNIFKEVKYTKTSNDDNKQVIDITVEEKPPGEILYMLFHVKRNKI